MRYNVLPARDLDRQLCEAWSQVQRSEATLDSPLLCPEFVGLVAEVRDDVEVAILEQAGGVAGFFAYARDRGDVARAVAGGFTDLQAVICPSAVAWEPRRLLRDCGLSAWFFDQVLASQAPLRKYHVATLDAPYINLANGFEAYRVERRRAGSDELREALRKSRKIQREVAPLRFEPYSKDGRAFEALIRWKRQQLKQLGERDCFATPWVLPLLERLIDRRGEQFSGMLSVLYVGDDLLAVNLGLRCGEVMHGWVTAFNRDYRKYSPGLILLAELAQAAESLGIRRIDMGRGDESFKRSFASGAVELAAGGIDRRFLPRLLRGTWLRAKEAVRGTSWDAPARRLLQHVR